MELTETKPLIVTELTDQEQTFRMHPICLFNFHNLFLLALCLGLMQPLFFLKSHYKLPQTMVLIPFLALLIFAILPSIKSFIELITTSFTVTNESLTIKRGLLIKSENRILIGKINEISVGKGPIQEYFQSGNVSILTGNDSEEKIFSVENVKLLRSEVMKRLKK